jgi:hypothetical protein
LLVACTSQSVGSVSRWYPPVGPCHSKKTTHAQTHMHTHTRTHTHMHTH